MQLGFFAEWGMVVFAAATAYFAYQSAKSSKRVKWLIGALESHSTTTLRMAARRDGIKVVAYDPSAAPYPARVPQIGEAWPLETIYLAVPPDFRTLPK